MNARRVRRDSGLPPLPDTHWRSQQAREQQAREQRNHERRDRWRASYEAGHCDLYTALAEGYGIVRHDLPPRPNAGPGLITCLMGFRLLEDGTVLAPDGTIVPDRTRGSIY